MVLIFGPRLILCTASSTRSLVSYRTHAFFSCFSCVSWLRILDEFAMSSGCFDFRLGQTSANAADAGNDRLVAAAAAQQAADDFALRVDDGPAAEASHLEMIELLEDKAAALCAGNLASV